MNQLSINPYSGDVASIRGEHSGWRLRVGDYSIRYFLYKSDGVIDITSITRRTTSTYRSRH